MRSCCPRGRGCNAPGGGEPCALELCREAVAQEPSAALALSRWGAWLRASELGGTKRERRFRLRGYERARDRALVSLALLARVKRREARTSARGGFRPTARRVRTS